jgi:glycerol-3-phosphate dehydrogenase (NAD(P)+)
MKAGIIGGGSWGSAFALHLGRLKVKTKLWVKEEEIYGDLVATRENTAFLPGYALPPTVSFYRELPETVVATDILFVAVPSQYCRAMYTQMAPYLASDQIVVSMTKGLEQKSLMRMSQVMDDSFLPGRRPRIAVLSGPSFAKEVAQAHPTAIVVASKDHESGERVQRLISSLVLRAYTSADVVGVEIGGALKNVVAIAAGITDALGFGLNTKAALITRGLVEITRLGTHLGAKKETFSGLAGMGDLILTCTGELSRNHYVGFELGKGRTLKGILSRMKMVAEGVRTTLSAHLLARREGVEMPITDEVYQVLYKSKPPRKAIEDLMSRALKNE